MITGLEPRTTPKAIVQETGVDSWRLQIPTGPPGIYRLAQLDDYTKLSRGKYPWRAPLTVRLEARASSQSLPGTWGFGLWNDPFSLSLGLAGATRRIPALPNTAWFFFASAPNYLSLRDDLPAEGRLAASFQSPVPQWPWILAGLPALPFLLLPVTARIIRRFARRVIQEDAVQISENQRFQNTSGSPETWRTYQINWRPDQVQFLVDGLVVMDTYVSPRGPLGLVIWVDNQYAAFPPTGKLAFSTLENPQDAWIEIRNLTLKPL